MTKASYPALSSSFFRGQFPGQLVSVFKDLATNPAKAQDFVKAINAGDVVVPAELTAAQQSKLDAIKGTLSKGLTPTAPAKVAPKTKPAADKIMAKYSPSHDRLTLNIKFPNGLNFRLTESRGGTKLSARGTVTKEQVAKFWETVCEPKNKSLSPEGRCLKVKAHVEKFSTLEEVLA